MDVFSDLFSVDVPIDGVRRMRRDPRADAKRHFGSLHRSFGRTNDLELCGNLLLKLSEPQLESVTRRLEPPR